MISSGWFKYGMIFSTGSLHAAVAAAPADKPAIFKKLLRSNSGMGVRISADQ
jgi:hypothetical protein